jgi:hypothetical protein
MRKRDLIVGEAAGWEGVETRPLPGGGVELRFGGRELGLVDADGRIELCFHPGLAAMLVETGRAEPIGPGRVGLDGHADEAVELLRLAHERARVAERVRADRG